MKPERIQALVGIYKRKQSEKKAEEKAKKDAKKKQERHYAVLAKRARKRTEKRKVEMYQLHLKRLHNLWKKENNKKRRKRINHRYYIKHRRRPFLRRRLHKGDEHGRFIIFFVKDKQYMHTFGWYRWKFSSIEKYNKLVKENHDKTICPVFYEGKTKKSGEQAVRYEILLKKKINPELEDNESVFRNELGESVTVKTDDPEWRILAKDDWYIEEDFYLYGYHPKYDRKDAKFIIKNVILKYVEEYSMCRIFTWKSYLLIENDDDFTFVLTKAPSEAIRLYNILYDRLYKTDNLYFTGNLSKGSVHVWVDKLVDKTGWSEQTVKSGKPIVC